MNKYISIKRNKDFKRAYLKGRFLASPLIVTYVAKNRLCETKIGITASKKIGNAVHRNRARRIIKEAGRSLLEKLNPGLNIVFVARNKTPDSKTQFVLKDMVYQLKKLGALK